MILRWQIGEVAEIKPETPRVSSIAIDVPEWPGHLPGQHVDVRLTAPDGYQAERSYSIASPPEEKRVTITVERLDDGEVSPYLTEELRSGDEIEIRGPIGGYFIWTGDDAATPLLLVAGGSGVVPFRSIIRHRHNLGSDVSVRLLYSARSLPDVIYQAELDDADDGVAVIYTLTRHQPPGWAGHTGRVDRRLLAEAAWPAQRDPLTFVCGPTPFVEAVASGLVELGYPAGLIKTERFGGTEAP